MMFLDRQAVPFFRLSFVIFWLCSGCTLAEDCSIRKTSAKLFCYYSKATDVNSCQCTHVVLPADADVKAIDAVRSRLTDVKLLLTVNSFSESLVSLLNRTRIDGLDLRLAKLTSPDDIRDFIATVRSKLGAHLELVLSVPARPELLAKHYDFKTLSKHVDSFVLETAFLGASANVTFHPSRLSGLWDVQNTDSVVDLVTGLGAPPQKLVISAPVQAFKFTLQDAGHTAPGSPALELSTMSRRELCDTMAKEKWTLERDQDQAGPYIFRDTTWIAFEDPTSIDIKSKYSRIRGLGGLALRDLSQDSACSAHAQDSESSSILQAAHSGLSRQSRAPRGAVLQSLERELLDSVGHRQRRLLDTVQVSPYRITRLVDTEGKVHAIRQDTRTEFECARQGYFVHPRSCGRFYRCVKFDQLSDEYSVFEFDCPAGLVFDARVEVCVWPGSLPQASACAGSSEIAPVPRERFICPDEPGYYADPENCRWFFACLDHGKSPMSAYEFRCPFGLVFDQDRLLCEWPWHVPKCSSSFAAGAYEEYSYGGIGTGALAGSGHLATEDNGLAQTGLVLGQYNGLGSLNSVQLGGLSGPLVKDVAKTYSSFNSGRDVDINGNVLDYKPIGTSVAFDHRHHQARLNDYVDDSHLLSGHQVNLYKIDDGQQDKDSDYDIDVRFASGSHQNLVNLQDKGQATSYSNLNQPLLSSGDDKINIIGGGFSAVSSGIELSQHGSNIGHIQHVTPLPIEGSSTIATVTSVPVPFVQSTRGAAGLDIYKDGVVANVPSLQFKVSPVAVNGFVNHASSGFKNVFVPSTTSVVPVAFVSSTPLSLKEFAGYSYEKPAVSLVESSSAAPTVRVPGIDGYSYPKPSVPFVEAPSLVATKEYLPPVSVTTVKPPVVVTKAYLPPVSISTVQTPVVKVREYLPPSTPVHPVAGQSYSYSHQNQVHTKLEQPVVQIQQSIGYEIPQRQQFVQQKYFDNQNIYNYAYQQPTVIKAEGYTYPKPTIKFEDIPKINQVFSYNSQPAVHGYAYSRPVVRPIVPVIPKVAVQEDIGYTYPKPAVHFVEEPLTQVVKIDQGYQYPKPSVKFIEHNQAISSQSFTQHVQERPLINQYIPPKVVHQGYDYPKLSIKFEERPILPPVVSKLPETYIYQKPQVTHYVNPLIPKVVSHGYSYPNRAVAFNERPLPPAVSSQSYVQHHTYVKPLQTKVVQPVNYGYSYPKPAIRFEERPAAVHQTFVTPRPVVHVQQENIGYSYLQPAIKFEEKPAVIQQTFVTPKPVLEPVIHVQQEHIGYSYPKPIINFEEKPAVIQQTFVTPKPLVQPVIHVQQEHIGYSYPQPSIKFEEKPAVIQQTFVTPKPLVQPVIHVQQEHIGYSYPKPTIKFEEKPAVIQQTFVTPKPLVQPVIHVQQEHIGYSYPKPIIKFEEKPTIVQTYVTPRPVVESVVHVQENIGYSYPQPTIKFEEKPAVIQQTFATPKPLVQPVIHVQQEHIGYSYPQPTIKFEEKPTIVQTFVTPKPPVQPVIHVQENIGYSYPKPTIKFEERPVVIQQTFVTPKPVVQPVVHVQENIYQQPTIKFEERPIAIQQTYVTPKPVVHVQHIQQDIGYEYPKPTIKFEEKPVIQQTFVTPQPAVQPVVHIQENIGYSYQQPAIKFAERPAIVHQTIVTPKPVVHVQQNIGYLYPKPTVRFEEKPVVVHQQTSYVKPVVQVQQNVGYTYPKPTIKFEERPAQPVSTYSFASHVAKQYIPPVTPVVQQNVGYAYPKPSITFEERPVKYNTYNYQNLNQQQKVVYETKPIQPAALPTYTYQQPRPFAATQTYHYQQKPTAVQVGYDYPKPQIQFEEKPIVTYETKQPVQEDIIVPKKAYVTGYQRVTPRPTYVSTVASVVVPKIQQQSFYNYDSRFESRPQQVLQVQQEVPIIEQQRTVVESKPIFKYEFSSLDNSFNSYRAPVVSTTPKYEPVIIQRKPQIVLQEQKTYVQSKPIAQYEFSSFDKEYKTYIAPPALTVDREYLPVQTTPKYVQSVQSRPISQYEFSSFDSRFEPQKVFVPVNITAPRFQINVPELEYLPARKVIAEPPKVYLPVSTTVPPRVYLPAATTEKVVVRTRKPTTTERIITIPKRTYLPVTTEAVVVTKPDRGYLPVAKPDREYLPVKAGKFIENYEAEHYENSEEVASRRPVKVLKIVRPKSKSIVKVNDFHPILSTKLGAQCTCTSNTLRLRKPAKKVSVDIEPETRVSDLEEYIKDENESGDIIIEDYQYEPQRIQDQEISVSRTPEVNIKIAAEELYSNDAPAPNLVIKKRLRGRPTSTIIAADEELPITRASDVLVVRSNRPRTKQVVIVDDVDDEKVVDAVRTGLKLVKSAVKEGVKEGIRESNIESKTFDRYGPGGVRSRSETLQGTIDCQRAGLFRHPAQCNKFYACRWDCKKNRFTLHVFNCPVHLTFDNNLGACNWPSQGPACVDNTLLPNE